MDFNNNIRHALYILITLASIQVTHISSVPVERQQAGAPGHIGRPNPAEPYTDLSIDQIISGVLEKHKSEDGPQKLLDPSFKYLSELDMVLTEEQYEKLYPGKKAPAPPAGKLRAKRKAVNDDILYWENATVTYELNYDDFSRQDQYVLRTAMDDWEFFTCVNFKAKTKKDRNFIRFQNGFGCNSRLGMVGGMQAVNLESPGCRWKGLYLHEIGHAFGLYHEHQLPQRDDYIYIIWENVAEDLKQWFKKYDKSVVDNFGAAYEYSSVMHYGTSAFSKDGTSQTIKAFDESKEAEIGRVYLKGLSFTDIKVVNNMYQCASHCPNKHCGGAGFMNKDCKCVCPVGDSKCKGIEVFDTEAYISKEDKAKCRNVHYNDVECDYWASDGECKNNPIWMGNNCAKSCKICQPAPEDIPKQTIHNDCGNIESDTDCHYWVKEGNCIRFRSWMAKNCRAACNKCNATEEEEEEEEEEGCGNIYDDYKCIGWAEEGECDANPDWMIDNCRNACGKCDDEEDKTTDGECINIHNDHECNRWADGGECDANPVWMHENCILACNLCKLNKTDSTCVNIFDDEDCDNWFNKGQCDTNIDWMHTNCKKSCKQCETDDSSGEAECVNIYEDDAKCERWAKAGECKENEDWMIENCRRACTKCDKGQKDKSDEEEDDNNVDDNGEDGCRDYYPREKCKQWANDDACNNDKDWMEKNCKWTCDKCKTDDKKPTKKGEECLDKNDLCSMWATEGQCKFNPDYMKINCQRACGICKREGDDKNKKEEEDCQDENALCSDWAAADHCSISPTYMLVYCKKSCGICIEDGVDAGSGNCKDKNALCKAWTKAGHCDINPSYMHIHCAYSCGKCKPVKKNKNDENETTRDLTDDTPHVKVTTTDLGDEPSKDTSRKTRHGKSKSRRTKSSRDGKRRRKSKDKKTSRTKVNDEDKKSKEPCRDFIQSCEEWARHGHCHINTKYMIKHCKKSCGRC